MHCFEQSLKNVFSKKLYKMATHSLKKIFSIEFKIILILFTNFCLDIIYKFYKKRNVMSISLKIILKKRGSILIHTHTDTLIKVIIR